MMDLSDEESFMNGSSNEQTEENVFEKDELSNHNLQQSGSKTLKREPAHRIFVNRSFKLSDIKYYGFDMDHTLAVYKTPQLDLLTFKLAIDRLFQLGYPKEITNFEYDPTFAIRGLWYDKLYGNLLKVDPYGNIMICTHGFKILRGNEIYRFYPNKFINFDPSRISVQHTLYEFPESYLIACVVNHFSTSPEYKCEDTGVSKGDLFISFKAIYQDIRESIDYLYVTDIIQKMITDNIENYIVKDHSVAHLLKTLKKTSIRENNAKSFLLTNAGYEYTDKVMSYLINEVDADRNWRSYFDYILVEAHKPLFFEEGTPLKEINIEKKTKNIGTHSGPILSNRVYCGGSVEVFSKLIGSHGKDVLYVGDHILGDIIKSKKERAWHTFLIVPELANELAISHENRDLFRQIEILNDHLSQSLVNLDSTCKRGPDIKQIKERLQALIHEMDMGYSFFGSAFRSGSRQTYFASQVTRYADIYSSKCVNLLHYPFFYIFKAPPMLMPHESTVSRDEPFVDPNKDYKTVRSDRKSSITLSNNAIKATPEAIESFNNKKNIQKIDEMN